MSKSNSDNDVRDTKEVIVSKEDLAVESINFPKSDKAATSQ